MTLVRTLFHAGFHHVVIVSHKTSLFFVQIQKTKTHPRSLPSRVCFLSVYKAQKKKKPLVRLFLLVETTGLEPMTSCV